MKQRAVLFQCLAFLHELDGQDGRLSLLFIVIESVYGLFEPQTKRAIEILLLLMYYLKTIIEAMRTSESVGSSGERCAM